MVEVADIFSVLNVYVVPNLNILLIVICIFIAYLYFRGQVKTTTVVKDIKGKVVPIEAKVKLPFTIKFLRFISCWLGVAAILLGVYSIYLGDIGGHTPFFNLMLIVVGVAATANDLYRFPLAAVITGLILILLYNLGPMTGASFLYNLQNPYVFGAIGFGSFSSLYLKLKFFGDWLIAGGKVLAKLELLFALVGLAEGVLSLF